LPVVSQRYAVDILDALADRPRSFAELRDCLRARRRELDRALRTLAAQGALRRHTQEGSWDRRPPAQVRYELTNVGRFLVDQLSSVDVWTTLYEYYLYGDRRSGPASQ
jgi:DNA-binding HxlR family transcriptional regulator